MRDRAYQDARVVRVGSIVFGAALVAFGAMSIVRRDGVPGIEPLPDGLPGRPLWALAAGVTLVAVGAVLVAGGPARGTAHGTARGAALTAAGMLALWLAALHLPRFALQPTRGTVWVPACEVLALAAAAWTLVRALDGRDAPTARAAFGATFLAFALSHVLYLGYVESVIPTWLPAPRFWALGVGAAHLAAGVSLLTGVRARLAATLLAIMFGSWVVMLHAPRVVAHAGEAREWGSLFVALAMCGASWIVAGTLGRGAPARPPATNAGDASTLRVATRPRAIE